MDCGWSFQVCVLVSVEYVLSPTTELEMGNNNNYIQQNHEERSLGFVFFSQLRLLMLQLFSCIQNWGSFFLFHLHLCTWHHSYWSRSGSICAVFWGNAFQISWCFKHFFFNLASKSMAHLWSPGIIQIWSTLGFWFTPCNLKHLGRMGMYFLNIFL